MVTCQAGYPSRMCNDGHPGCRGYTSSLLILMTLMLRVIARLRGIARSRGRPLYGSLAAPGHLGGIGQAVRDSEVTLLHAQPSGSAPAMLRAIGSPSVARATSACGSSLNLGSPSNLWIARSAGRCQPLGGIGAPARGFGATRDSCPDVLDASERSRMHRDIVRNPSGRCTGHRGFPEPPDRNPGVIGALRQPCGTMGGDGTVAGCHHPNPSGRRIGHRGASGRVGSSRRLGTPEPDPGGCHGCQTALRGDGMWCGLPRVATRQF